MESGHRGYEPGTSVQMSATYLLSFLSCGLFLCTSLLPRFAHINIWFSSLHRLCCPAVRRFPDRTRCDRVALTGLAMPEGQRPLSVAGRSHILNSRFPTTMRAGPGLRRRSRGNGSQGRLSRGNFARNVSRGHVVADLHICSSFVRGKVSLKMKPSETLKLSLIFTS